jgi:GNAT superfamily N-acetyltransferase
MSAGDDEQIAKLRSHPETRRYLRFFPETMTVDEARLLREKAAENSATTTQFKIEITDGNKDSPEVKFAGTIGFYRLYAENNTTEVGLLVSPDMHRKGIATEAVYVLLQYAFEVKKLHRVTFVTGADNIGILLPHCVSVASITKFSGMRSWLERICEAVLEGEAREAWKDGDGYSNSTTYAILDWEWRDRVKARLFGRLGPSA